MKLELGTLKIEIQVRRIWNKEWRAQASKEDIILGTIGLSGVLICLGVLFIILGLST